jgi:transposase
MSSTFNRRYKRNQQKITEKINKEVLERTKDKSPVQTQAIIEQIKKKYGLIQPTEEVKD